MCFIYLLKYTKNGLNINHNGILYMVLDSWVIFALTYFIVTMQCGNGGGREGERKGKERAETEGVETREKIERVRLCLRNRLRCGDICVIVRFMFLCVLIYTLLPKKTILSPDKLKFLTGFRTKL